MEHDAELMTSTEILIGQIPLSVTPNQPFAMYNRWQSLSFLFYQKWRLDTMDFLVTL